MLFFLRNEALDEHAGRHGISREDAEYIVRNAELPYPEDIGDGKFRVWGRTSAGEYVQVIFAIKDVADIDYDQLTLPMLTAISEDESLHRHHPCHADDERHEEAIPRIGL